MSLHSAARSTLLFVLVATFAGTVSAATLVELVIDEATKNRTVAWPVTTGVPFPQGALTKEENCRLLDEKGKEHPLQSKVAATWDAARSSIRWLTIDFIAQPGRKYWLEFGPKTQRSIFESTLQVANAGDAGDSIGFESKARVVVATGPLHVEFSQTGPSALRAVRADLNGDGKIAADETVVTGPEDGDHLFWDHKTEPSSSTDDGTERKVIVETSGPVRTTIRVDGWYTGPDGRRVVAYRTRYHFFAGLSAVKLIDEFRIIGSTRDVKFDEICVQLSVPWPLRTNGRVSVADPTKEGGDSFRSIALDEDHHQISLTQETFRHYGNPECRGSFSQDILTTRPAPGGKLNQIIVDSKTKEHFTADRVGPWMQVADDRCSVTGSLRNFWQQFPKGWEYRTDAETLSLQLWNTEAKADPLDFGEEGIKKLFGPAGKKYLLDWSSGGGSSPISDFFYYAGRHGLKRDGADGRGINKHHEIWYHFGRASEAAAGREYGALADKQPLCLATGKWNVDTGVFGPLAARTGDRKTDSSYEGIVDRIFELERNAQDDFGDYGWFLFGAGPHYSYQWDKETKKHYADPRRFEYHTYQRETQLWWSYFRSGERKFHDWCLPSENHWVDIAVAHVPMTYSTEWRGGKRGEAKLHYPAGDWSIDSPLHYVRHHDTGEAWLRSASQFWGTYHRTLETTTLAYYLTGDERYNDVVEFWKDYWGALAGVRSDSTTAKPWHMDQMWWAPTAAGAPSKSWAEMVRDYAPFQSGSRHQQTLFFNLSTLYEHTWDPTIKQVLDEYAAAFIKPENPNGVWQCQDHHLPASADSPMLAHYWAPSLWKYARASGDKRMPDVLKKYFTACLDADPYGGDVGIYSNNQIGWAWHFTKDPRALVAARRELARLEPHAKPLEKPEDLGNRIYNPYAPIMCLATVPRLIPLLEEPKRMEERNVAPPQDPSLEPQRNLIAICCDHRYRIGKDLRGVLWGWDSQLAVVDEEGNSVATTNVVKHRSHRQPFDRNLAGFPVYRTEFVVKPEFKGNWIYVSPKLETGILDFTGRCLDFAEFHGGNEVWCWAGEPVQLKAKTWWAWHRTGTGKELVIESPRAATLAVAWAAGERELPTRVVAPNRLIVDLTGVPEDQHLGIMSRDDQTNWLRIVDRPDEEKWISPTVPRATTVPPTPKKLIESRRKPALAVDGTFAPGRFGKGLYVAGGSEFEIPDEITKSDGTRERITDPQRGSIEFWVRRLNDERIQQVPRTTILNLGTIQVAMPQHVPLDEWSHVAVDWYPTLEEPDQIIASVYVNGVDHGNYRSIYWSGYGDRTPNFTPQTGKWLGKFKITAPPGTAYMLDDVRLSSAPRYVDATTPFGRAQTFNPKSFIKPTEPAKLDAMTLWLAPLDGKLEAATKLGALEITKMRAAKPTK